MFLRKRITTNKIEWPIPDQFFGFSLLEKIRKTVFVTRKRDENSVNIFLSSYSNKIMQNHHQI